MAKDLRSYLTSFKKEFPDRFIEEKESIDPPHHEVAAYLKLMEDKGELPVTLFQNVKNVHGKASHFPLIHNIFATRSYCALAIGMEPSNYRTGLVTRFAEIQENPIDYEVVAQNKAPVMEKTFGRPSHAR